jgi:hypothetical protein
MWSQISHKFQIWELKSKFQVRLLKKFQMWDLVSGQNVKSDFWKNQIWDLKSDFFKISSQNQLTQWVEKCAKLIQCTSAEWKVSFCLLFSSSFCGVCFDCFVMKKYENFPRYFFIPQEYSYFLIFLINALSSPSTWICIWNMSFGDNLFTVLYKHEMKKKYKRERRERKTTHWWGCIEKNVKHLQKILFAMTLFYLIWCRNEMSNWIEWRIEEGKKINFSLWKTMNGENFSH